MVAVDTPPHKTPWYTASMREYLTFKKVLGLTVFLLGVVAIMVASFFFADYVASSSGAQTVISQFGYLGVIVISFIAGFNIILPVPPATFVPIFLAAGLTMPIIIACLVAGTLIADLAGYLIGTWGRGVIEDNYPKTTRLFTKIRDQHYHLIAPLVFLFAAFVPLPNEAFVIPLAMMSVPVRNFIVPLVLGTTVYHLITVYGVQNLFAYFF